MPDDLIDQPGIAPTRKVTAAAAGAAAGTVVVLGAVWLFGAEQPPPGLEGALGLLGAFGFGWAFRDRA